MPSTKICTDIFEANISQMGAKLTKQVANLQTIRASVQEGGDYKNTIDALIECINAAHAELRHAARLQRRRYKYTITKDGVIIPLE